MNSSGTLEWQKCLGGTNDEWLDDLKSTSDGGYILTGQTESNDGDVSGFHGGGTYDCWVVKLDSSGSIVWQRCLGGTGTDGGGAIQQTSDGGYIVCGWSNSNDGDVSGNHGGTDIWLVKLDSTGNTVEWQKSIGGSGSDVGVDVYQCSDGGYVIGGYSNSNNGDASVNKGSYDIWVVKTDDGGNVEWEKSIGSTYYDYNTKVYQASDGEYIVGGTAYSGGDKSTSYGVDDIWIVKLGY